MKITFSVNCSRLELLLTNEVPKVINSWNFITDFEIVLFNSYVSYYYWDYILEHMPVALTDRDQKPEFIGGGFWMRRK